MALNMKECILFGDSKAGLFQKAIGYDFGYTMWLFSYATITFSITDSNIKPVWKEIIKKISWKHLTRTAKTCLIIQ